MNQKKNLIYISETSLPTKSANIINSLKFCDALASFYNVKIFIPNNLIKYEFVKKNYNLKNEIKIISLTKNKIHNFRSRLFFCFKVIVKIIFEKNRHIISRSILSSLLLALINIENTLELHHEPKSFSKLLFNLIMFFPQKKKLNLILINKSLIKTLKIKKIRYLILDDGADINNNKSKIKINLKKNSCVYMGSFYDGKGIEIIIKLSKLLPQFQFHLYGDIKTLQNHFKYRRFKNVKFFDYVSYKKIPNLLKSYKVALMPYQNKIKARSNNLEISKYISPLKMFDYLAAGNIIVASRINAYRHILKNNVNSYLISNKDLNSWKVLIKKIFNNSNKFNSIKIFANYTAKKYSWDERAKKYHKFIKN